jgi:hypothetical protein
MLQAASVCMLAQEQPRRPVFKVIGIIPTDQLNQKRITQRSRPSGKGRRQGSRRKGGRGYQDGSRRQGRKGRRQGAERGGWCERLFARKVSTTEAQREDNPGLGRGFLFLFKINSLRQIAGTKALGAL